MSTAPTLPQAGRGEQINTAVLDGGASIAAALVPEQYQPLIAIFAQEEPVVFHLVSALIAHLKAKK